MTSLPPYFHEHLDRLHVVLNAVRSGRLSLKPEKCHFAFQQLKFFGHVVSPDVVSPYPDKTAALSAFATPTNKSAVRGFLVVCADYRRFVANFSQITEPPSCLTKEDVSFVWSLEKTKASDELKAHLQSIPYLGHFDEYADTKLHTFAINFGLSAVLEQWQDGGECVIAYASRALSRAEANYSPIEKECLAVIWAVPEFRPHINGKAFRLLSDRHCACCLANLKDPAGRLERWSLRPQ